jgi:glycosyltransferase involved in cell wall biosynthesis
MNLIQKNKLKELSIAIPIYHLENEVFVKDCLDSIYPISEEVAEIIIVFDGISENLKKIVHSYNFSSLKIITNRNPKGLACVLNQMINSCKTRYMRRIDADDILVSQELKSQFHFMTLNQLNICGSYAIILNNQQEVGMYRKLDTRNLPFTTLITPPFIHPTVILDVEYMNSYSLRYPCENEYVKSVMFEDWYLWNLFRKSGAKSGNYNKPTLYYRIKDVERQFNRFKASIKEKKKLINQMALNKHEIILAKLILNILSILKPVIRKLYHLKYS